MNLIPKLQSSHWQCKGSKAELICDDVPLMQINFKRRPAKVEVPGHHWQIIKERFWCSALSVVENDKVILSQKQIGFWGNKHEILIEDRRYFAKIRQRMHIAIAYSNETEDVLEYRLNGFLRKPRFIFNIKAASISENDLLLLLAVGLYSIRRTVNEYNAAVVTTAIVAAGI